MPSKTCARKKSSQCGAVVIPAATKNDSYARWYEGRDCGPRSEQGIAAKAAPVVNEGPVGGETRSVSAVRHKTAKKCQLFGPLVL